MRDEVWMQRCLELAGHGLGLVAPNPMVGAVIAYNDRVIGEGFHHQFGAAHAEVLAIGAVQDKALLSESTLYVNLEPCSHFGKTPPCANLIIGMGIRRVVVGQEDPNSLVSGRGIAVLRAAGIRVDVGIEEAACRHLNRRFNHVHMQGRPYLILKWAQSADGFMDRDRGAGQEAHINWISHPESNGYVHRWRTEEQAILVGFQTVINDNPRLTPRLVAGNSPLRIVLAGKGVLPPSYHLLADEEPTLIFHAGASMQKGNKQWIHLDGEDYFPALSQQLMDRGIHSLLVEGGRRTLDGFIAAGWLNEIRVILSSIALGSGLKAPEWPAGNYDKRSLGRDTLYTLYKS